MSNRESVCFLPEMETVVLPLDVEIKEEELEIGANIILTSVRPSWNSKEILFKVFTDGITNKLIGCSIKENPSDVVLVRVYGKNSDLLIDREAEKENFKLLHKAGFAPRLYATFKNGLAYEFVPGNVINVDTVKAPTIYPLIASMMAKIHTVHRDMNASPCLWYKIEKQLKLIPSVYTSKNKQLIFEETFPNGIEFLWKEFVLLKSILSKENSPIVFCHNDLLLANIIHQGNKITFIDYEYASCNYQAYDIGNHFAEFSGVTEMDYSLFPGEDFQRSWLRIYLEEYYNITSPSRVVSEEDVSTLYQQVNRFVLASHLYWATWALVQGQHSSIDFDFIRYGAERMKEYEIRKRKVL
ncbi:ethanolamine kinase 1 isoform X3 [Cimex lectularius]|nr:ethanolamine kinase 1 isoform X3 [Cimex lectularius]XP_014253653.1 ethanolamine kinase 1 isoform X3 [Cimex lectularius]XP_024085388.1 ethanolamine kinase 1 isoform X3 [Cimex lectularius]XP_024085389.1 ethanolamine kinase 1 isoform X3 [Cimex lectularius]XP_024085390.1 ethanolamine kinase 1 isoform X3 [Cimex lectularius]